MYDFAYDIQRTAVRDQIVFQNQIYLNLHSRNERGCIGNNRDCSILEQVYHGQKLFQDINNPCTIFVTERPKLDEILSLYLINRLLKGELIDSIFSLLKQILDESNAPTHWVNMQTLFLACDHINTSIITIEKIFFVLDELIKQPTFQPQYVQLMLEGVPNVAQELSLLTKDYSTFLHELQNRKITQEDSILVATKTGEIETINAVIYKQKSACLFLNDWLRLGNYGLVLTFDYRCTVETLQSHLSIAQLAKTLTYFERYYTKQVSQVRWQGEEKVVNQGSKLSHNQIIDIVKNYTDPYVSAQSVKYVFPFHFDYMQFDDVRNFLNRNFIIVDESHEHQKYKETFLPLVNDYFFNNDQLSKKQTHSVQFMMPKSAYAMIDGRNVCFSFEKDANVDSMYVRTVNIEVRQFRYGVGFLVLESTFKPTDFVPLPYVLDVDQLICSKVQEAFQVFLGSHPAIKTNATRRGIAYESIEVQQATFYKERKENLVLKTCSANKRTYISESEELKQELEQKYLSRGDHVFYGFSRSCGVQYLVDNGLSSNNGFKKLGNSFMNEKFHIFLFAAQKRDAIRQFSDKLVGSSIVRQKLEANRIRKDFLDFMTQVKLSHISDHNVITRFYTRWEKVFESDAIFAEVSEKLTALDGYQQTQVTYQFTVLSFIVFPIVALSALFTMGILKTTPFELDVGFVIAMNIILIMLFFLYSKRK